MDEYLAIMNPAAGGGKCAKEAPSAIETLRKAGLCVDVTKTQGPGEATEIVRKAFKEGRRKFIAIGGDGTSFEVVNGLFPLPKDETERPLLGFLPLGTGNSFLKDFTDQGTKYSIQALIEGRRRPCDVIQLRHRDGVLHYINLLSMGFVADVTSLRNRCFSALGESGYVLGVLLEMVRLHPYIIPMSVDTQEEKSSPVTFVSINNSRFTGGKMMMAPKADIADGRADLITVKQMGRCSLLKAFPKIFNGSHIHLSNVNSQQVQQIDFNLSDELEVMVDGEALTLLPQHLEVLPGALEAHA